MSTPERRVWLAAGGLLLAVLLGLLLAPARFPHAWLAGFALFAAWPLGSLALLFVHALTGGRWGEALRPALLAGAGATLLLPLLVIPVLLNLPALYAWARPEGAALPNRFWLNPSFFAIRGGVDLVVWLGLALAVLGRVRLAPLAPFALLALAVTSTFAAIDLTMSLDPAFTSSAYGMISGAAALVLAIAGAILLSVEIAPAVCDDIGRLLLGLCALLTYLGFMQLLIVWQNDLATQTPWYLVRTRGAWGLGMALIALAQGPVPILALLAPRVRRTQAGLRIVAWMLVGAEVLRCWWTVLPPRLPGLVDVACMGFIVALTLGWTMRRVRHG